MNQFTAMIYIVQQKIDFTKFEELPTTTYVDLLQIWDLQSDRFNYQGVSLRINKIFTADSLLGDGTLMKRGEYFVDMQNMIKDVRRPRFLPNGAQLFYTMHFSVSNEVVEHVRKVYTFFNLLGYIGGLLEIIILIAGLLVAPWAEFVYIEKALQLLYHLKSKDLPKYKQDGV